MKFAEPFQKWGLVTLALPLLAMLTMVGMNFQNVHTHTEYIIEIEGYDPRDLLRGHYLIFRYKWPENAADEIPASSVDLRGNYCACFDGHSKNTPQIRFQICGSSKRQCEAFLPVQGWGGRGEYQPAADLRQYYIPEEHGPRLEQLLRNGGHKFEVGIVPRAGTGQLKMLYIDGMPLPEFLATVPVENENTP